MAHEITVKVRFSETDALGHVSNISYFIYLEEARIEFFRELGLDMTIDKWSVIMISANCMFYKQAYFDQRLKVTSFVTKIGNSSFKIGHRITDANSGELIAEGDAGAVYFDFSSQKSERIPDGTRAKLEMHKEEV
ncbi:acyl-CoA thioester hydrolase [Planococcus glaciei]|uniref:acyl-CoA thioesterase n=1 Tax=Planococcus glaciei TaxID=459472 RepID=UPI00088E282E|nr:thioesterase family protein [Planococcus glaciei]SDG98584.1 acyl-CoA thioester hydrolase [Planococcus glaciei]